MQLHNFPLIYLFLEVQDWPVFFHAQKVMFAHTCLRVEIQTLRELNSKNDIFKTEVIWKGHEPEKYPLRVLK